MLYLSIIIQLESLAIDVFLLKEIFFLATFRLRKPRNGIGTCGQITFTRLVYQQLGFSNKTKIVLDEKIAIRD